MKKFLTTLAVLTVFATPAFAQSFDPENGTGNVLPFSYKPTVPQNEKIAIGSERPTLFRHGSGSRLGFQFEQSGSHGRWQSRL
jgi:hypothetical protein